VNSGADSESQSVKPSQNVGRSSNVHVPPEPSFLGFVGGSFGNVTSYVMSFPEPGSDDLKASDGSSCPTYSDPGVLNASRQSDAWLSQSGSVPPVRPAVGVNAAGVAGLADPGLSKSAPPSAASRIAARRIDREACRALP
jgi:hypothetical protein